jgi:hypothetical protein
MSKKVFTKFLPEQIQMDDGKIDRWEMYEYCMNNYQ